MRPRRRLGVGLVVLLTAGLLACGGDDICLNCPNGTPSPGTQSVTVSGNIASSNPFTSPPAINVVICLGLNEEGLEGCPTTFFTVPNNDGTFSRSNVEAGALSIFFWVDQNQNGMIEPDDLIAQLSDPEGLLDDVGAGRTVNVGNARILFLEGTATASITVTTTPTPTPSPGASPTPTRTP